MYLKLIEQIEVLPAEPNIRPQGRATGVEIKLRTEGEVSALLEIKQLKTKRKIQLSFLDTSSQRHK